MTALAGNWQKLQKDIAMNAFFPNHLGLSDYLPFRLVWGKQKAPNIFRGGFNPVSSNLNVPESMTIVREVWKRLKFENNYVQSTHCICTKSVACANQTTWQYISNFRHVVTPEALKTVKFSMPRRNSSARMKRLLKRSYPAAKRAKHRRQLLNNSAMLPRR